MSKKNRAFDHSKYRDWISPEDVQPYELNAKIHTDRQIENIANSIARFGWQQDVVITTDNVLVIGHSRRLAAMKLCCKMPYHRIDKAADELTDEDIRELRIADNATNAQTRNDFDILADELADLSFEGFDFDLDFNDSTDGQEEETEEQNEEQEEAEIKTHTCPRCGFIFEG